MYNQIVMYAALLLIFSIFSATSFSFVVVGTDPYSSGLLVHILFFISLFFSLAGGISLGAVLFLKTKKKNFSSLVLSRRSVLVSTLVVLLLLLYTYSLLNLLSLLTLSIAIVSAEIMAIKRDRRGSLRLNFYNNG